MIDWRLYVIVNATHRDPVGLAEAAIRGGAGVIQLRDKRGDTRAMMALAKQLLAVCGDTPLIINDRVDVALAVGAAGVHVGPNDMPVADVRRLAPDLLIGASTGTPMDAQWLVEAGADYLGSGAVFDASASKPDAVHNRGIDALAAVVAAVDVPVVGIGGIDESNVHLVRSTGAAGIAIIRAVADADDPEAAAQRLL